MPIFLIMNRQNPISSMTKIKILIGTLALIGLLLIPIWHKSPAPQQIFTTITGQQLNLQKMQGHPVIVTFWATDCPACVKEIPHLIDLYQQYHTQGLEVIAISMFYDPPSHVVAMSEAMQIPYPIVLDIQGKHAKAFNQVKLTPNTFVINAAGEIDKQIIGPFDPAALQTEIELLLRGSICCG